MQRNFATLLIRGLIAGFVSALAWDMSMVPGSRRDLDSLLFGLFLILLPGMLYSLAISLPISRGISPRKPARLAVTAVLGGMTFYASTLVVALTYARFGRGAPLLGGFTGSLIFGAIAFQRLWPDRPAWPLACYVLSGTIAALAFVPLCSRLVTGPDTPSLHWSLYLGFPVWQGTTAATFALFQPAPNAKAAPSYEV